ncbi:MAG TPA: VCBS repeat-containing protein [Candidatus Sulfomarinibacteraceae bacterium]|nr:VCBS repeat-containing protein [Candidatus Sulfomarinibacteraceae bacterium]
MRNSGNVAGSVRRDPAPSARLISNIMGLVGLLILGLVLYYAYNVWMILTDSAGTFHHASTVVDLDGDDDLDVIMHHVRTESEFTAFGVTAMWFNQGDGRFTGARLADRAGETGWAAAAGDVDGDGDADLFVFPGYRLRLVFNEGGDQGGQPGMFGISRTIAAPTAGSQYGSLLVGDVDGDDRPDVVVAGCCGRLFALSEHVRPNYSWVWHNRWGASTSRPVTIDALQGLALRDAALGDLDGDGDLDLFGAVIAPAQGYNHNPADRVLFNDGAGNFTDSGQRLGASDSTAVALGDVDGDGDLDALVGKSYGARLWINQGRAQGGEEGTFEPAAQLLRLGTATALFLVDLDGDGDLDALIGSRRQATIWWNDGQGAFTASGQRFHYTRKHGLAVGDFDGDGRPDIFAGRYTDGYRVWFNQGDGAFSQRH